MQPIEGITPESLWVFFYVLVAILAVAALVFKVIVFYQGQKDRKEKKEKEARGETQKPVAGIQEKLKTIETRLDSIDEKLDRDKKRLEKLEGKQDDIQAGFRALCNASLALLNHEMHNGNTEEMEAAQKGLQTYLLDQIK